MAANVDEGSLWDVSTLVDGAVVDMQTVSKAADLVGNDWVDFKASGTLEATAGKPLEGGENVSSINGESHQAFLDKICLLYTSPA